MARLGILHLAGMHHSHSPLAQTFWPTPVAAAIMPRSRPCVEVQKQSRQHGCVPIPHSLTQKSIGPSLQGSSRTELEGADMKEIDGLLSHINKITHDARSGHREDSHGNALPLTHTLLPSPPLSPLLLPPVAFGTHVHNLFLSCYLSSQLSILQPAWQPVSTMLDPAPTCHPS